ncbi:ABC transporter permease [Oenococcus oeni]|uniref:ABC transporter permease subunit n=1 Tax=Oenococcus oeni TaxID=1247 RepID=A0AAJ2P274_OENOE|nr:ABC transporter permease [Oenococcus oeni]MDV7715568.1 ABC transporter permease subunit [Oenococcus oeni]
MKKNKIGNLYLWLVFIVLYVPIFYLITYSFNSGKYMHGWKGFSLIHYGQLWADTRMIEIVVDTLIIAFLSSVLATIIGTFGALWINFAKSQLTKNILLNFNSILLVSPDVIIGASFLIFFTAIGLSLGFLSVLLSHIAFSIPIVVLMVLPRLQEMPLTLTEAAEDLGANFWQVLNKVTLPYISSGIMAGFFMALTYSLDDFAVTFFVTGNGFSTLSVEIYSRARQGISLEINALSAIMFIVSLVLVFIYYFISRNGNRKRTPGLEATK